MFDPCIVVGLRNTYRIVLQARPRFYQAHLCACFTSASYGARSVPEIVPKIVPKIVPRNNVQGHRCVVSKSFLLLERRISMFVSRNAFGRWLGHICSTEVLPGPPKYLPYQCCHRARLPEIVPEICSSHLCVVPKSFLLLGKRISMFVSRNVFQGFPGLLSVSNVFLIQT